MLVAAARSSGPSDALLAKRDGLLRHLRNLGTSGIRGAGLTRIEGKAQLLLLVAPGTSARMPKSFDGVPVLVRETGKAKA